MTTNYDAPDLGAPKLAESASGAFRALLWGGLTAFVIAAITAIIGFSNSGYGEELAQVGAFAFSGGAVLWGVILLTGAGVIAGLGKREPAAPAPASE